ncbi:LysM peptidoglycan-binding domain-containing protein [Chitinolyticbacter albus]|uniref:LysM peptidoglycan-binding domain-containing protein n=1 Tax=Chitinolyticbacter albus TaxID=2961951 RepID=UPI00210A39EE|nr:LysM peptidoglycan-binding domain-containing protein [Chitinolyticbacter albus]
MFVSATYDREKLTVHYIDENGEETLYTGGSFAWRFNNPGNIAKPGKRVISTVIGYGQRTSKSGLFCIFPDPETGRNEKIKLIKEVYGNSTLSQMMYSYAPPNENDTEGYINQLTSETGIARDEIISKIDGERFKKLIKSIGKKEGFIPGEVTKLGRPVQIELKDATKQPLPNTAVKITAGKDTIHLKTDEYGFLPKIYPSLLQGQLKIYLTSIEKKTEAIFKESIEILMGSYTLTAPFVIKDIQPEIHKKNEKSSSSLHIVKSGETLTGIAKKYDVSVEEIMRKNGIKDRNKIYSRQHLDIPLKNTSTDSQPKSSLPSSLPAPQKTDSREKSSKPSSATPKPPTQTPAQTNDRPTRTAVKATAQRTESNHPAVAISSPNLQLSGAEWCKQFPTSTSLDDLLDPFKTNAKNFIAALKNAGIKVKIAATFRPVERSYMMHYAAEISRGKIKAEKVPAWAGVNIDWVHRNPDGTINDAASKAAAAAMAKGFQTGTNPVALPGTSNHNKRRAVDMSITGYENKKVKSADGNDVTLKNHADLVALGLEYSVIWLGSKDKPHWSFNGK